MVFLIKLICIIFLFLLLVMIVDGNRFVIRTYTIETKKATKDYHFVLLADLHNKRYGKGNDKLIRAIRKLNPDAVLCAGDMLTAKSGNKIEVSSQLLRNLANDYPVYCGIGNHEYRMKIYREQYGNQYEDYIERLKRDGIVVLENDSAIDISHNICIQGVMIDRYYYKRFQSPQMQEEYIEKLIGNRDSSKMQIFLAHNPDYFSQYVKAGADLVLSGHYHGGVMRLPGCGGVISPKLTLFPRYDGGIYRRNNSSMIVSRGLGMHTIPIRIFNPGELVYVTIKTCKP